MLREISIAAQRDEEHRSVVGDPTKSPTKTGMFDLRASDCVKAAVPLEHQCGDTMRVSSDKLGIFRGPVALMASFPSSSLPPHADVHTAGVIVILSVGLFLMLFLSKANT